MLESLRAKQPHHLYTSDGGRCSGILGLNNQGAKNVRRQPGTYKPDHQSPDHLWPVAMLQGCPQGRRRIG